MLEDEITELAYALWKNAGKPKNSWNFYEQAECFLIERKKLEKLLSEEIMAEIDREIMAEINREILG